MNEFVRQTKNKLTLKEFEVLNTSNLDYVGNYMGFNIQNEEKKLSIKIVFIEGMDMEFDMIGYDPSIVNAIRRVLLSEVPAMAIEKVHLYQNTSVMQDEVLAHRMGLIPLKADPRLFVWKPAGSSDEGTEQDTLEFTLNIRCSRKPGGADKTKLEDQYINHHALTKHIKWVPKGGQAERMSEPGPVEEDILINKLRPGHELQMRLFAVKGLGRDHAKFSPVATVFYRLLPAITIVKDVFGDNALRLQQCFSPGVIELEPTEDGRKKAVVVNARLDSCSRNVYRYEDLKDMVVMEKIKDHYIFTVESVGAVKPHELVVMACDVLVGKCDYFLKELDSGQS